MILIKDNKLVECDEKEKDFYINSGYSVVNNKKAPAKKADEKVKDNKTKDDEGKKLEGDLENL